MFELFKPEPIFINEELTKAKAMDIYALIKQYGDSDSAYKNQPNSAYPYAHFVIVDNELSRIYSEHLAGTINITSDILDVVVIIKDINSILEQKNK